MTATRLVSVIVPIYNVEGYIKDCIDSLINQTYRDVEIILIDDGSTDGSGMIIDRYAKKDSRIISVHQPKNAGVSAARNTGLKQARGEYIVFVDADDMASQHMVTCLLEGFNHDDVSLSTCRFSPFETTIDFPSGDERTSYMDSGEFLSEMLYGHTIDSGPFCKMFKRTAIGELRFNETMAMGEDFDFLCAFVTKHPTKVYHSSAVQYGYRVRPGSAMMSGYSDNYKQYLLNVKEWLSTFKEKGFSIEKPSKYRLFGIASYCIGKMGEAKMTHPGAYELYNKVLRECCVSVALNRRTRVKNRVLALLYTLNTRLTSWARCKIHGA